MIKRRGSVNPKKFPAETFQLYSIPSYDKGVPEILKGRDIGSSKKIIEKNDVLLSRIVPHIRRCWVINDDSQYRRIGSGEWIIFNSDKVDPYFLKYFFVSAFFSVQFLKDLRGVGGSLLRANPEIMGKIKIPLPPLPIQRRIAAILDRADALRRLDRALLDKYDELGRSVFLEMFGTPAVNPKKWQEKPIVELCISNDDIKCGPFGTQLSKSEYRKEGVPLWAIPHVNKKFAIPPKEFVSVEKAKELKKYNVIPKDIVMTRKGTVGNCAVYPDDLPESIMHSDLLRLRVDHKKCNPLFLSFQLNISQSVAFQVARISSGAVMAGINVTKLKSISVLIPPIELQNKFAEMVDNINMQKKKTLQQVDQSETLFQSILQHAFRGEL